MDRFTAQDGTTYVMDTDSRYPLTMARDMLTREWGRTAAARALLYAKFRGPVVVGGTKVTFDQAAGAFTITDIP